MAKNKKGPFKAVDNPEENNLEAFFKLAKLAFKYCNFDNEKGLTWAEIELCQVTNNDLRSLLLTEK